MALELHGLLVYSFNAKRRRYSAVGGSPDARLTAAVAAVDR